jgi:hypothetical protein
MTFKLNVLIGAKLRLVVEINGVLFAVLKCRKTPTSSLVACVAG